MHHAAPRGFCHCLMYGTLDRCADTRCSTPLVLGLVCQLHKGGESATSSPTAPQDGREDADAAAPASAWDNGSEWTPAPAGRHRNSAGTAAGTAAAGNRDGDKRAGVQQPRDVRSVAGAREDGALPGNSSVVQGGLQVEHVSAGAMHSPAAMPMGATQPGADAIGGMGQTKAVPRSGVAAPTAPLAIASVAAAPSKDASAHGKPAVGMQLPVVANGKQEVKQQVMVPQQAQVSLAQSIRDAAAAKQQQQQQQRSSQLVAAVHGAAVSADKGAQQRPVGASVGNVTGAVQAQPGAVVRAAPPKPAGSLSARGALPAPKVLPQTAVGSKAALQGQPHGVVAGRPQSSWTSADGIVPPLPPHAVQLPPPPPNAPPADPFFVGGLPMAVGAPPPASAGLAGYSSNVEWIGMGASIVKLLGPQGAISQGGPSHYHPLLLQQQQPMQAPFGGYYVPSGLSPPLSPPPSPGPFASGMAGAGGPTASAGQVQALRNSNAAIPPVAYSVHAGAAVGSSSSSSSSSDEDAVGMEEVQWASSLLAHAAAPTLRAWLDALGMGPSSVTAQALDRHGIGFSDIGVLCAADWHRLGVPNLEVRRLLAAGAVLRHRLRTGSGGGGGSGSSMGVMLPPSLSKQYGSSASLDLDFQDEMVAATLAGLPEQEEQAITGTGSGAQPRTPPAPAAQLAPRRSNSVFR